MTIVRRWSKIFQLEVGTYDPSNQLGCIVDLTFNLVLKIKSTFAQVIVNLKNCMFTKSVI